MNFNSNNSKNSARLTSKNYWSSIWNKKTPSQLNLKSYYNYRLSQMFSRIIPKGVNVLEVGCGGSLWLPYFAKALDCKVWGIDYTEKGAILAEANLKTAGVSGTIVIGDIFLDNQIPEGQFDFVWTNGFIEHFRDIPSVLSRLAVYLKPTGRMITLVPNVQGIIGLLHSLVDKNVYDSHVIIPPKLLDRFHVDCGFTIEEPACYLGVFSLGVINFSKFRHHLPKTLDNIFWTTLQITQQGVCLPWRLIDIHPESKTFSPWIIGVYKSERLSK